VLLFATARTAVGERTVQLRVPAEGLSARDLVAELGRLYPSLAPVLAHARYFRDGNPVQRMDERVHPGDEFAVHPPYGGG
jgi:molybdopterin converting factor small subunit